MQTLIYIQPALTLYLKVPETVERGDAARDASVADASAGSVAWETIARSIELAGLVNVFMPFGSGHLDLTLLGKGQMRLAGFTPPRSYDEKDLSSVLATLNKATEGYARQLAAGNPTKLKSVKPTAPVVRLMGWPQPDIYDMLTMLNDARQIQLSLALPKTLEEFERKNPPQKLRRAS